MHVEVILPAQRARELVRSLQTAPPLASSPGAPVLRRGASGKAVRLVQKALRRSGSTLEKDGIFGPRTEHAVRAFQNAHGLEADGIVGLRTWPLLRRALR